MQPGGRGCSLEGKGAALRERVQLGGRGCSLEGEGAALRERVQP